MTNFTPSTKVLVIGCGVVGAALADELTLRGAKDVTVIDQGPLFDTGGSSSHAPGFVFQTNPSKTMCELAQRTLNKLDELNDPDGEWLLRRVGGVEIATTEDQLAEIKRRYGFAQSWGVKAELISAEECKQLWPMIDTSQLLGALHTPTDAVVNAKRSVAAQAKRAADNGAMFHGHTQAVGLVIEDGKVRGVNVVDSLSGGNPRTIDADIVIAAGGIWGPTLGSWLGINLPMQPVEHGFSFTEELPEFSDAVREDECHTPLLRHQGAGAYLRQQGKALAIGAYEHRPIAVAQNEIATAAEADRTAIQPAMKPFTDEDFDFTWREVKRLMPSLADRDLDASRSYNGLFSFTPDGGPLLGPSPTVDGVWVAQAVWVTHSAGLAQVAADWIVTGQPGIDTTGLDLRRFDAPLLSEEFGIEKGKESYDEVYDVLHPRAVSVKVRGLRTSPFYHQQKALGAVFQEANGWERPLWLEENRRVYEELNMSFPKLTAWDRTQWSPVAAAEAWVTRNRVAMYDMSSLYRLRIKGPEAADFLQRLTTNNVKKAPGSVTYSMLLDEDGGILSDVTITRLSESEFMVGGNGPLDLHHFQTQQRAEEDIDIEDITPGTCCVGLWGPLARRVLESLTPSNVSHEAFGYFKAKRFYVAGVPVLALRVSYVGELGWEIYTSSDHGQRLWDEIYAAGQQHGIIVGGRLAFNAMRLEKGYRSYGSDMTREHTPAAAGLGFAVGKAKRDYLGYEALEARTAAAAERLVTLVSEIPDGVPNAGSPVYNGEGVVIGYTASADIGYTVGKTITYSWLAKAYAEQGTELTIGNFARRVPAIVAPDVLVDPDGEKLRYA